MDVGGPTSLDGDVQGDHGMCVESNHATSSRIALGAVHLSSSPKASHLAQAQP